MVRMSPENAVPGLNARAGKLFEEMVSRREELRLGLHALPGGGRVLDAGVESTGGIAAGIWLSRVALADLAHVSLVPGDGEIALPLVQVHTDHPVAACMASQYAGWSISAGKFFAMGSGPMRAAYGGEELYQSIGHREEPISVVGLLETRRLPGPEVVRLIAEKCRVKPEGVSLLVAPTASLAGTVQVVSRSVETALHKLHALGFDLRRVAAGQGTAPLAPVARDDLSAIGRTNDCVLYGARVVLWVRGDDQSLAELGPRVPSSASPAHGAPFSEIFERAGRDFYKIDPGLFSPAEILLQNLDSGRTHRFGGLRPDILRRSLFS
jgi:methenyltetrahydromethanopterin cyclohydrolase